MATLYREEISIPTGDVSVQGDLVIPTGARGLVLFAHGSGSSRFSPRNQFVAEWLQKGGIATLLMDLLTPQEEALDIYTREYRFDIQRLANRLDDATDWLNKKKETHALLMGYFGSSTGAAAALVAAADKPAVRAVVSRGGRPDLAGTALPHVHGSTLLIIGGDDTEVIKLNRQAFELLRCEKKIEIVPGATHLFEEPGTLEQVAELARSWFLKHFVL